jgi:23S rRNA pseudouridine2604 synthase
MRLNQYIASCGVCSRREADRIIEANRVYVNDSPAKPGMQVEDGDRIFLDGKEITPGKESVVLAYYKPVGVVCTEKDVHAKRIVMDEIDYPERVTYAGRLDKDSEGLLLLSNDGNLINSMMKGSARHEKEYEVEVDKDLNGEFLKRMSLGVFLKDLDRTTRPCVIKRTGKRSFRIILTQGLNRQIRRMCAELGYEVTRLKRIRVMTVKLEDYNLAPGKYKKLDKAAVDKLFRECGL